MRTASRSLARLADDADDVDDRHLVRGERAEEPVLPARELGRQLLQRVDRAAVLDEADDVPVDAALDLDQPLRVPLFEGQTPGQVQEVRVAGARDELQASGHGARPSGRSRPRPAVGRARRGHLKAGADIEASCRVGGVAHLQSACTSPCQPIEAFGEQGTSQTASLVGVLDSHRLHESDLGHGVEPEECVTGNLAVGILYSEVERRLVEGALPETFLDAFAASPPHGVRTPASRVCDPRARSFPAGRPRRFALRNPSTWSRRGGCRL